MIGGHRFLVSPLTSLGDGARFGLEPLHALVGLGERRAGGFQLLPRGGMGRFAGLRGGFGLREALLRGSPSPPASASRSPSPLVCCASFCSSPSTLAIS